MCFAFIVSWRINIPLFSFLYQSSCNTTQPISGTEDRRVHNFSKSISLKVNLTSRLEFKLSFFDAAVRQSCHYVTEWKYLPSYLFHKTESSVFIFVLSYLSIFHFFVRLIFFCFFFSCFYLLFLSFKLLRIQACIIAHCFVDIVIIKLSHLVEVSFIVIRATYLTFKTIL